WFLESVTYPCGFFFQAEDGIRDFHVTGVQTCALPISAVVHVGQGSTVGPPGTHPAAAFALSGTTRRRSPGPRDATATAAPGDSKIGRASCRERVKRTFV